MTNTNIKSTSGSSIGFGGLLAIVFIVLKLTGYIAWSWWWVLSPLWIPACFLLILMVIAAIIGAIILARKQ